MVAKDLRQSCALVIVAEGFDESETIPILSLLRQAGLCVKSVGLTSGLVGSAHGVWIMPDLTLAELEQLNSTISVSVIILPDGRQSLARLEADPRVHRLLRQVVAQRGRIVTSREGLRVPRAAALWGSESQEVDSERVTVLLREPEQSPEIFVQNLIRILK